MIRSHPEGSERCLATAIKSVYFTPNMPHTFTCHAGLLVLTVPLVCGGELLGALATGELRALGQDGAEITLERLHDLDLDKEKLLYYFAEIPVKKREDVIQLGRLINSISNCFLSLGMAIGETHKAEVEKALIESELKALNSQINPHFLFNTLNAIQMVSYLEDANQTSNLINALANLLRVRLDTGSYFTTLREELQVIKNLLFIQKTRFEDRLQIAIFIPEDLLEMQIPSLSLQPLVENALIHGLEPREGIGRLELRAFIQPREIIFLVKDNGVGIGPADLGKIRDRLIEGPVSKSKKIGLVNINQRCKTLFGNGYGIKINSERDKGTEVFLRIPILSRNKGCELGENIAR